MADMSLDELLSSSIKSAAEPAASAGVADAIRSRVAAGDAGTTVAGSTAPGWGGGASGLLTIVAPIALIVVAGAVGGVLGVTGAFGSTQPPVPGDVPGYLLSVDTEGGSICPGGPASVQLAAGTRVLAVARSDDDAYLGVRNPGDAGALLWFPTSVIVLDDGGTDPADLPVSGCPEVTVTLPTPVPTEEPTQPTTPPSTGGGGTTPPPPPSDTTAPTLSKMNATPTLIINDQSTLITVSAADNVGVSSVQLTWAISGNNGSAGMTLSGGVWRYTYSDTDLSDGFGNITFTARAYDAAGNQSAPLQVVVNRQYLG